MNNEMTLELLERLSPEQQEAWRRCLRRNTDGTCAVTLAAALLELASTKRDLANCIESHKKVNAELETIWTILDEADCATFCQTNMGPGQYGFAAYQEYLSTEPKQPDKRYDCDCWKSRLPK